jgi:hypothetical protein
LLPNPRLAITDLIAAIGLFAVAVWCILFPRRVQAVELRRLRDREPWSPSAEAAARLETGRHLWRVRMRGLVALFMAIIFSITAVSGLKTWLHL